MVSGSLLIIYCTYHFQIRLTVFNISDYGTNNGTHNIQTTNSKQTIKQAYHKQITMLLCSRCLTFDLEKRSSLNTPSQIKKNVCTTMYATKIRTPCLFCVFACLFGFFTSKVYIHINKDSTQFLVFAMEQYLDGSMNVIVWCKDCVWHPCGSLPEMTTLALGTGSVISLTLFMINTLTLGALKETTDHYFH